MPRRMPIEADANLRKAREAALLAVETYNRPGPSFRTAGFLVLMVVAWTALFHAIFAKRKVKPYYRQKRNPRRFERVDGVLSAGNYQNAFSSITPIRIRLSARISHSLFNCETKLNTDFSPR